MFNDNDDDSKLTSSNIKLNEEFPTFSDIFKLWRDPHFLEDEPFLNDEIAEVVTQEKLPKILNNLLYEEMRTSDMTNLGNMLLGIPSDSLDDPKIARLSLAHENLNIIPKIILNEFGHNVKILDITHNNIVNLDFLEQFTELTSLIADQNPINSTETNIPWMPKLELLYLNNCKISDLHWIETLQFNCPKLKYLSLMGNPVVPCFRTELNMYQYLQYRLFIISVISTLIHLDDKKITPDERNEAKKIFPTPLIQRIFKTTKAKFPHYFFRSITGKMNLRTNMKIEEKNIII